jgi:hypothetical protein
MSEEDTGSKVSSTGSMEPKRPTVYLPPPVPVPPTRLSREASAETRTSRGIPPVTLTTARIVEAHGERTRIYTPPTAPLRPRTESSPLLRDRRDQSRDTTTTSPPVHFAGGVSSTTSSPSPTTLNLLAERRKGVSPPTEVVRARIGN